MATEKKTVTSRKKPKAKVKALEATPRHYKTHEEAKALLPEVLECLTEIMRGAEDPHTRAVAAIGIKDIALRHTFH
jgi:hypothetical protein